MRSSITCLLTYKNKQKKESLGGELPWGCPKTFYPAPGVGVKPFKGPDLCITLRFPPQGRGQE
jgi:hypothetical protein